MACTMQKVNKEEEQQLYGGSFQVGRIFDKQDTYYFLHDYIA